MTGWNMPPGCSVSDIPGNSPEDMASEAFEEFAFERFEKALKLFHERERKIWSDERAARYTAEMVLEAIHGVLGADVLDEAMKMKAGFND